MDKVQTWMADWIGWARRSQSASNLEILLGGGTIHCSIERIQEEEWALEGKIRPLVTVL
jgi:hypothetical protein